MKRPKTAAIPIPNKNSVEKNKINNNNNINNNNDEFKLDFDEK
jgi:hypothetical protein